MVHGISLKPVRNRCILVRLLQAYHWTILKINRKVYSQPGVRFQCLTPSSASWIIQAGVPSNRISVIPNAIDATPYQLGSPKDFQVIFIGRMQKVHKGLKLLSEIIRLCSKQLPDVEFCVIGDGPGLPWLRSTLSGLHNYRLLGATTDAQKVSELARSSVMLVTSTIEPFSIVLLEGGMSGLLVLSTPVEGSDFVLGLDPSLGHILDSRAETFVQDIARAFLRWKDCPQEYMEEKMSRRTRFMERFDEDIMVQKYSLMIKQ